MRHNYWTMPGSLLHGLHRNSGNGCLKVSYRPALCPVLLFFIYLFIYFWLHWVFVAVCGLSVVRQAGATLGCGVRASHCGGFSCCGAQALQCTGSVVVAHGLSCSVACGIFLDQGSNPVSPALAGGFLTTEPSGKPCPVLLNFCWV